MKNIFNTFWKYIGKSVMNNVGTKVSTTRIQSYFILGSILTATAVYLGIDIVNGIFAWIKGGSYVIPSEHVVLFGMVLTHHLWLLGINKRAERKTAEAEVNASLHSVKTESSKEDITPESEEEDHPM